MKKLYVIPRTKRIVVSGCNFLSASFADDKIVKREHIPETMCPFNNEWCCDKQKRLEEWRKAVAHLAKNKVNFTFFTYSTQFNGCPYGYGTLCAQHEQKQRD